MVVVGLPPHSFNLANVAPCRSADRDDLMHCARRPVQAISAYA